MKILRWAMMMFFLVSGCQVSDKVQHGVKDTVPGENRMMSKATFAGGCFWCTEADFEKVPGVVKVVYDITPKPPSTIEYI